MLQKFRKDMIADMANNDKNNNCAVHKTSIGGQAVMEGVMMRGRIMLLPLSASLTVR